MRESVRDTVCRQTVDNTMSKLGTVGSLCLQGPREVLYLAHPHSSNTFFLSESVLDYKCNVDVIIY